MNHQPYQTLHERYRRVDTPFWRICRHFGCIGRRLAGIMREFHTPHHH